MMLNYIVPLKAKGYPAYREKIQRSKDELIRMIKTLEFFIEVLRELEQNASEIENCLI